MDWTEVRAQVPDLSFPLPVDDFVAEMGGLTIEYATGTVETVEEVCGRVDVDVYASANDAQLALAAGLDGDAVGRKGYSDRDPPIDGLDEYDPVSC